MEDFETPVEKAQETSEPTYAEAFPPLCNGASNGLGECAPSQWTRQPTVQGGPAMALKSSMVTQVCVHVYVLSYVCISVCLHVCLRQDILGVYF